MGRASTCDGGLLERDVHAPLDINMPNYAGAIVSTEEIVAAIAAP